MARRTGGRIRALAFLALSVGAGTLASVVVGVTVWSMEQALQTARDAPGLAMVEIPVASHEIARGTTLTAADLTMVAVPADIVPEGIAYTQDELVGRVPHERLLAQEPLRVERLAPPGELDGLATLIPRGMRALSVVLADDDRVSGFLDPGNRVDLLVFTEADDGAQTRTLLTALEVLAVTRETDGDRGRPQVVLQAVPEHVEQVAHAIEAGKVKLTLRSDIDLHRAPDDERVVTTSSLLGDPSTRISLQEWRESRAANPHLLTVIRGPESHVEQH